MIIPVHVQGSLLGLVTFVRADNPTPFREFHLLLAQELVNHAALALDNARRYAREQPPPWPCNAIFCRAG
ncbi:GAF domain-containing protein [Actinacidiphila glaucinigra]